MRSPTELELKGSVPDADVAIALLGSTLTLTELECDLKIQESTWSLHVETSAIFATKQVQLVADLSHPLDPKSHFSFSSQASFSLDEIVGSIGDELKTGFAKVGLGDLVDNVLATTVSKVNLTVNLSAKTMTLDCCVMEGSLKGRLRVQVFPNGKLPGILVALLPEQGPPGVAGLPLSSLGDQAWILASAAKKSVVAATEDELDKLTAAVEKGVHFKASWNLRRKGTVEPLLHDLLKLDSVTVEGDIESKSKWSLDVTTTMSVDTLQDCHLRVTNEGVKLAATISVTIKSQTLAIDVEAELSEDTLSFSGKLDESSDDLSFKLLQTEAKLEDVGILMTYERKDKKVNLTEASFSGRLTFGSVELDVEILMEDGKFDDGGKYEISAKINLEKPVSLADALSEFGVDVGFLPKEVKKIIHAQLEILYLTYKGKRLTLGVQVSGKRFSIVVDDGKYALIVPLGGSLQPKSVKLPRIFLEDTPSLSPPSASSMVPISVKSPGILTSTFVVSSGLRTLPISDPALLVTLPECRELNFPDIPDGLNFKLDIALMQAPDDPILKPLFFIADLFQLTHSSLGLTGSISEDALKLAVQLDGFGWNEKSFSLGLSEIGVVIQEVPEVEFTVQGQIDVGHEELDLRGTFAFGPDFVKGTLEMTDDWKNPFGLPITIEKVGVELTVLYTLEPTECAIWGGFKAGKIDVKMEGYVSVANEPGMAFFIELENMSLADVIDLFARPFMPNLGGPVEHLLSVFSVKKFKFVAVNVIGGYTLHEDSTHYDPGFCLDVQDMTFFGLFSGSALIKVVEKQGLQAKAQVKPFVVEIGKVSGIGGGDIDFELSMMPKNFKCHLDAQIVLGFFGLTLGGSSNKILFELDVKEHTQYMNLSVDLFHEALIFDLELRSTVSSDVPTATVKALMKIDIDKFLHKHHSSKKKPAGASSHEGSGDKKSQDQLAKVKSLCASKDHEYSQRIAQILKSGPEAMATAVRAHPDLNTAKKQLSAATNFVNEQKQYYEKEREAFYKEIGEFWFETHFSQKKTINFQPHVPVEMRLLELKYLIDRAETFEQQLKKDVDTLAHHGKLPGLHQEGDTKPGDSYDQDLQAAATYMGAAMMKKVTATKERAHLDVVSQKIDALRKAKNTAAVNDLVEALTEMHDFHQQISDEDEHLDVLSMLYDELDELEENPEDLSPLQSDDFSKIDLLRTGLVDHLEDDATEIVDEVQGSLSKLFGSKHLRDQADILIDATLKDLLAKAVHLTSSEQITVDVPCKAEDSAEQASTLDAMKKKVEKLKKAKGSFELEFEIDVAGKLSRNASIHAKFHFKAGKISLPDMSFTTKLTDGGRIAKAIFQKMAMAFLNDLKDLGKDVAYAVANAAKDAAKAVGKAAQKAAKDAKKDLDKSIKAMGKGVKGVDNAAKAVGGSVKDIEGAVAKQAAEAAKKAAAMAKEAERKAAEAAKKSLEEGKKAAKAVGKAG